MDYVDLLAAIAAPPALVMDRASATFGADFDPIHEYADLFGPVSPPCAHCRARLPAAPDSDRPSESGSPVRS